MTHHFPRLPFLDHFSISFLRETLVKFYGLGINRSLSLSSFDMAPAGTIFHLRGRRKASDRFELVTGTAPVGWSADHDELSSLPMTAAYQKVMKEAKVRDEQLDEMAKQRVLEFQGIPGYSMGKEELSEMIKYRLKKVQPRKIVPLQRSRMTKASRKQRNVAKNKHVTKFNTV